MSGQALRRPLVAGQLLPEEGDEGKRRHCASSFRTTRTTSSNMRDQRRGERDGGTTAGRSATVLLSSPVASPAVGRGFEIVCEVEPATHSDLMRVRHQIAVLSRVASSFLIPDNHIGRATVSSVAVAHEVGKMGGQPIACLNARDRNVLGLRRDLLTAAAYGVQELLFVYGDRPPLATGRANSRSGSCSEKLGRSTTTQITDRHSGSASRAASGRCRRGNERRTSCSSRCRSRWMRSASGGPRSTSPAPSTQVSWWLPVLPWGGSCRLTCPS
jgi:hypothetical protein